MYSLNSRKLLAQAVEKWPAKVLSVAVALILFVFHRMSTLESRFFSVPLRLETSSELIPASSYTRIVRVSLRGDANSIYPIMEDDIEAYVDLKKYTADGWYRSPVQIRKKGSALGVEPLEISVDPLEVSLRLERKAGKTVPLIPSVRGAVESGYELISQSLSPAHVSIEGPLSALESVPELYTDEIDLGGRSESFSVMVNILNRDPLLVLRGNGAAEFRAVIRPEIPVRNINGIPITVRGLAPVFRADTGGRTGSVRFEGKRELLDRFTSVPGLLSVDCSALKEPGTYTMPVSVDSPEGLVPVRREPEEITVIVTLKVDGP
jgi:YbbR domain-containing protein